MNYLYLILISLLSLLLSNCGSEKKESFSGPLISELDKKNDSIAVAEQIALQSKEVIAPVQNLINNTNVTEKLTDYGIKNPETKVIIKTKLGNIKIRLFEDTPLHRANFLMLTKKKYFDSTLIYRVIYNFVIQGGNSDRDNIAVKMSKIGNYKIPDEISSKHIHKRGVIAMAVHEQDGVPNDKKDKRSSPYNFYIVQQKPISDKYMDKLEERYKIKIPSSSRKIYKKYGGVPHLDGDFTVFGEVYSGMSVVNKIAEISTDAYDRPREDLFITIEVIE